MLQRRAYTNLSDFKQCQPADWYQCIQGVVSVSMYTWLNPSCLCSTDLQMIRLARVKFATYFCQTNSAQLVSQKRVKCTSSHMLLLAHTCGQGIRPAAKLLALIVLLVSQTLFPSSLSFLCISFLARGDAACRTGPIRLPRHRATPDCISMSHSKSMPYWPKSLPHAARDLDYSFRPLDRGEHIYPGIA